jgi:hypothetical protein
LWTALRPQYWPTTVRLAKNSRRASMALSDWLRTNLVGARAVERVVTLDTADHLKT